MRRSGYRWMKVSFLCAVSEPPCSSQDGWGGGGTVVIGRRALSAYNPSLKPAFMRGVHDFILIQIDLLYLADPGKARGCSTNSLRIHSFINSVSRPFPPTAVRRRHAQTVRDTTSSYKIDYVIMIKTFLNPEGHQIPFSGSKVKAILLKGWIWPIGGVASGSVCACSLRSRLVYN